MGDHEHEEYYRDGRRQLGPSKADVVLAVATTRTGRSALKRGLMIQQQLLAQQLAALELFPEEDPFEDGDVIRFKVRWDHDKEYIYAAVRANGLYYVTGQTGPNRATWGRLVGWLLAGEVTAYDRMVPAAPAVVDTAEQAPAPPASPPPTVSEDLTKTGPAPFEQEPPF